MKPINPRSIELLEPKMVEVLRAMSPAQRLERAFDCNRTVRACLAAQFRMRHPEWDETQIRVAVAQRMLYGAR
jgi:hypothetical protein